MKIQSFPYERLEHFSGVKSENSLNVLHAVTRLRMIAKKWLKWKYLYPKIIIEGGQHKGLHVHA